MSPPNSPAVVSRQVASATREKVFDACACSWGWPIQAPQRPPDPDDLVGWALGGHSAWPARILDAVEEELQ